MGSPCLTCGNGGPQCQRGALSHTEASAHHAAEQRQGLAAATSWSSGRVGVKWWPHGLDSAGESPTCDVTEAATTRLHRPAAQPGRDGAKRGTSRAVGAAWARLHQAGNLPRAGEVGKRASIAPG
ncbi:hypothetical protein BRADI_4g09644v3 [Brachypodium distachyon]|uniref:Uncharacterized protein n=1 Tax=Brachypodium distachyon TaxID=15368 RepID=A0A0Q3L3M1_BRADI|nr:hypothetical protein BRADI_4g09644v3 [Brachypodium distachyon]